MLLSGIQHFMFCRRQWALIHIEQQWEENVRTIEGAHLHEKADQPLIREKRGDQIIVRALPVFSRKLGITGICDVVEFVKHPDGITLSGEAGTYIPVPIEYKRGRPKKDQSDISQLTAQAMCLEEMFLCEVTKGYLYYHEVRRRVEVLFTKEHREQVQGIFKEMHMYYRQNYTPKVKTGPHCQNCSLQHVCVPHLMQKRSVARYIEGKLME